MYLKGFYESKHQREEDLVTRTRTEWQYYFSHFIGKNGLRGNSLGVVLSHCSVAMFWFVNFEFAKQRFWVCLRYISKRK
jgi:hypothetical protein